jgi:glycosyltransferase involved in cell wall biosynthesis
MSGPGVEGHGPVSRERLFRDFYPRAHGLLVPSRAEGYGFAAVEGLGHGVPVIASRRDALPEIVGDAGMLVEPGDVGGLADAMRELAADPGQVQERGAAGRRRFEAEFTRERARERLGGLYRRLLGES